MEAENNPLKKQKTIRCRNQLVDLSTPKIMGILNVTPDSFYPGSRFMQEQVLVKQAGKMLNEGADFLDIGGHTTKPGAETVPEEEELERTIPAIEKILQEYPDALISIDTYRASVAEKAVNAGACMVNDISGGDFDEAMFDTVAKLQVPYILMHIQGTPKTMQQNPTYDQVTRDIITELSGKVEQLRQKHIPDLIIDPGFGFGKTVGHNYQLLRQLTHFRIFELPVMVGLSRKSMATKVLDIKPEDALNATTVLNTLALLNGADMLRVHDAKEAKEAVKLVGEYVATQTDSEE